MYGLTDFVPGAEYHYAMRLGASLMAAWTLLLVWASRRPIERRGVLPLTIFVIGGLAWAGAYAVSAGLIALPRMIPTWVLQAGLVALFLYSYLRSLRVAVSSAMEPGASTLADAAEDFLSQEQIAVAGVSRAGDAPANLVFNKLRQAGRDVYAINPNAEQVDGAACYGSIADLPAKPDCVVIATHPDQAIEVARQCRDAGIERVWFHRSIDRGSYSAEAAALCEDYGAIVIPGSCPMMHLEPVDIAHRCMRGVLSLTGKLPKVVEGPGR